MKIILSLLFLLFMPYVAQATDCQNPQNQNEINQCTYENFQNEDKALNANYKKAMTLLPGRVQESLKATQQLWIQYKQKHCELMSLTWEGGSAQGAAQSACLSRLTSFQNKEIDELLKQYSIK